MKILYYVTEWKHFQVEILSYDLRDKYIVDNKWQYENNLTLKRLIKTMTLLYNIMEYKKKKC